MVNQLGYACTSLNPVDEISFIVKSHTLVEQGTNHSLYEGCQYVLSG